MLDTSLQNSWRGENEISISLAETDCAQIVSHKTLFYQTIKIRKLHFIKGHFRITDTASSETELPKLRISILINVDWPNYLRVQTKTSFMPQNPTNLASKQWELAKRSTWTVLKRRLIYIRQSQLSIQIELEQDRPTSLV